MNEDYLLLFKTNKPHLQVKSRDKAEDHAIYIAWSTEMGQGQVFCATFCCAWPIPCRLHAAETGITAMAMWDSEALVISYDFESHLFLY